MTKDKQSAVEIEGKDYREGLLSKYNFYQKGEETEYSTEHEDAKSHNDENHPWGKGTPDFIGEAYTVPDHSRSKTEIKEYSLHTQDNIEDGETTAGGSYDKYGRNGKGGREYLKRINIYNKNNEYGVDSVDITISEDEGQYFFATRDSVR